ncbi:MAG: glycosyltransferase [Gelidibacter sp.]
MKTICFVVPIFPSVSETFVTNQIIGAKKQGYSVFVLTNKLGNIEKSSQRDLIEKYDLLKDTIVIDYGIPKSIWKRLVVALILIIRYFGYWINPARIPLKHRILNWPFLLKFYGELRHIDVFHVQFAMGGLRITEMKKCGLLKSKLIITFHGHDAHFKNEKVFKQLQNHYKILFDVSDFITVNTTYLKNIVVALGCQEEKLCVIPMGIDIDYFKTNVTKELSNQNNVKLISIGRLIEIKGFEYAIHAVRLLVDRDVSVNYTIVGDGVLLKSLQNKIEILKLENHVKLVGEKSQTEIKRALGEHHIYLMSSITDSKGSSETQGVVTAEAQAMGLPVIAFNIGGIPYTIRDGETGIMVREKDVEAYAQAILKLINHPDRYQLMSEQARKFVVTNFSNKIMTACFTSLYEK